VGPEPKLIEPFPFSSNCMIGAASAELEGPSTTVAANITEAQHILDLTFLSLQDLLRPDYWTVKNAILC